MKDTIKTFHSLKNGGGGVLSRVHVVLPCNHSMSCTVHSKMEYRPGASVCELVSMCICLHKNTKHIDN